MREEDLPASVAPERFQTDEGLVACARPELAGPFETALILSAGGFDGSAAQRFTTFLALPILHPVQVGAKVIDFFLYDLSSVALHPFHQLFQRGDDLAGAVALQVFEQWLHPDLGG